MTHELPHRVPFFKPSFTDEEEQAVCKIIRSGWLTTGKETLTFEQEFAQMLGVKHALAVNSASNGLILALKAAGIGPGTGVITSPYTFVSTATAVLHLGAELFYADIESDSYNIDADSVEKILISHPHIRAIIPIHIAGKVCDMERLSVLAKKYQLAVIEDCAHAFPSKTPHGYAGTLGTAGVFSFYATKTITTGEGGMICTNDDTLAEDIKVLRSHGINRSVWDRYTNTQSSWWYDVTALGYKCNLPDILSAIGRVQLRKADCLRQKRKAIALQFNAAFAPYDCFTTPPDSPEHAWHLYQLSLVPDKNRLSRDAFAQALQARGLGISVHFIPHFHMQYFKTQFHLDAQDFPYADRRYQHTISLPFWPDMSQEDIDYVIKTVIDVAKH